MLAYSYFEFHLVMTWASAWDFQQCGMCDQQSLRSACAYAQSIAPDKAAYCVFTQFRGPENAIKLISVRTTCNKKPLILNSELFRSVWRYCILFAIVVFRITSCCWVQIYTRRRAESSLFNCKPVQEHSYRCLAIPNIYTITTFVSLYNNNGVTWAKKAQRNWMISYRN